MKTASFLQLLSGSSLACKPADSIGITASRSRIAMIPLTDIYLIRVGDAATAPGTDGKQVFSIVYGPNYETIDLVAENKSAFVDWVTGLQLLTPGPHVCIQIMQQGTMMTKVYPETGKTAQRTYNLSADMKHIGWTPTRSRHKRISLASIKDLRIGEKEIYKQAHILILIPLTAMKVLSQSHLLRTRR